TDEADCDERDRGAAGDLYLDTVLRAQQTHGAERCVSNAGHERGTALQHRELMGTTQQTLGSPMRVIGIGSREVAPLPCLAQPRQLGASRGHELCCHAVSPAAGTDSRTIAAIRFAVKQAIWARPSIPSLVARFGHSRPEAACG